MNWFSLTGGPWNSGLDLQIESSTYKMNHLYFQRTRQFLTSASDQGQITNCLSHTYSLPSGYCVGGTDGYTFVIVHESQLKHADISPFKRTRNQRRKLVSFATAYVICFGQDNNRSVLLLSLALMSPWHLCLSFRHLHDLARWSQEDMKHQDTGNSSWPSQTSQETELPAEYSLD